MLLPNSMSSGVGAGGGLGRLHLVVQAWVLLANRAACDGALHCGGFLRTVLGLVTVVKEEGHG